MRSILVFVAVVMLGCSGEDTKEVTAGAVGGAVEHGKGVVEGMAAGLREGREKTTGSTGARTITRAEDIHRDVELSISSVTPGQGSAELVVAFRNRTQQPLHVAGIDAEGNAVLLDQEGFASTLSGHVGTVRLPASAAVRVTLRFSTESADLSTLRLWGEELSIGS